MRRRTFMALVGGGAGAWTLPAQAQQTAVPVIGFLRNTAPAGSTDFVVAFRQGLNEAGFAEGQNVAIEYRWAENQHDRLAELAADLALSRCRAQARRVAHRLMSGGDTGRIAPRLERFGAEEAVSASRDEMTRNGEDVVGGRVQGQETLG